MTCFVVLVLVLMFELLQSASQKLLAREELLASMYRIMVSRLRG